MKLKLIFSVFLCFCILLSAPAVSAGTEVTAAGSVVDEAEFEYEFDIYVFNINEGNIYISKSPSSDFRSAGGFLIVEHSGGESEDLIPAEAGIMIVGSGEPTTNRVIVNGSGLSGQKHIFLMFKDTLWDSSGKGGSNENNSDIVEILNTDSNSSVDIKILFLENNTLLTNSNVKVQFEDGAVMYINAGGLAANSSTAAKNLGTIKIGNLEVSEKGMVHSGVMKIDEESIQISIVKPDENGINLSNESGFMTGMMISIMSFAHQIVRIFAAFF